MSTSTCKLQSLLVGSWQLADSLLVGGVGEWVGISLREKKNEAPRLVLLAFANEKRVILGVLL